MGISYDKIEYFSKDNSNLNKKKESKNRPLIKAKKILKNFNKEENEIIKKESNKENLNQNNELLKFSSNEQIQQKDLSNKNTNSKVIFNHENNKDNTLIRNPEMNQNFNSNNENHFVNKDNNERLNVEKDSVHNVNSNSSKKKELQMIDENIKLLFMNFEKYTKEKENTSNTFLGNRNSSIIPSQELYIDYELNFIRSGNDLRNSYIQKLVSKALYLPNNRPKTHNSLIIFDWDDTLLPTTFLTKRGIYNEEIMIAENKKIQKLENSALKLLNMSIDKGEVYIITNACLEWVEYSAEKFYPRIFKILPKIKVISARGHWESEYPGDSRRWKIQTFLSLKKELNTKLVTNIICLGDSLLEIEAGRILANSFSEAFVKTIKFKEEPKLEELNKQLLLVTNQFNSICSEVKNLIIRVEKKKKGQ